MTDGVMILTSHPTQERSFWRHSSKPIYWHSTEETNPNTTKANNTTHVHITVHNCCTQHSIEQFFYFPDCPLDNHHTQMSTGGEGVTAGRLGHVI